MRGALKSVAADQSTLAATLAPRRQASAADSCEGIRPISGGGAFGRIRRSKEAVQDVIVAHIGRRAFLLEGRHTALRSGKNLTCKRLWRLSKAVMSSRTSRLWFEMTSDRHSLPGLLCGIPVGCLLCSKPLASISISGMYRLFRGSPYGSSLRPHLVRVPADHASVIKPERDVTSRHGSYVAESTR